ncbi:uncharacterized protein B0T15DRAFT_490410 [Chaetomium strumarium]|uniref:Transmembrane protein n=1 Tax=Chaetomium strumarium TaxID=1170767 RepID=A0AAJ0GXQ8_9PEZI|nr:hypothetical protein B0T15DRAFT_490410 [Chaetomium strumarium]
MARLHLWFTGFTFLSLVANIVFLLGCVSPTFEDIALYRVNVTLLAEGLQKQAFNDTRDVAELRPSDLPTYWYWGPSGICDVYETEHEVRCRRALPPTQDLLTIVKQSVQDRYGSNEKQLVDRIVSSWNATLSSLSPSVLRDTEARFASQSKASVALVVIAIPTIVAGAVPAFEGDEWKRADFTYTDAFGAMARALEIEGVTPYPNWSTATTYHIEVKSTEGPPSRVFFVSELQVKNIRGHHKRSDNAYILAHVYDIGGRDQPGVR